MKTEIGYHHTLLHVEFPDTSIIYRSSCAPPTASASELVLEAVRNQACPANLVDSIKKTAQQCNHCRVGYYPTDTIPCFFACCAG